MRFGRGCTNRRIIEDRDPRGLQLKFLDCSAPASRRDAKRSREIEKFYVVSPAVPNVVGKYASRYVYSKCFRNNAVRKAVAYMVTGPPYRACVYRIPNIPHARTTLRGKGRTPPECDGHVVTIAYRVVRPYTSMSRGPRVCTAHVLLVTN